MRLIDADALKQEMLAAGVERNEPVKANALCSIINSQPTVPTFGHWISANQPPEVNEGGASEQVLLSFENFPGLFIGNYVVTEKVGAYCTDEIQKLPLYTLGIFVNAWMPLPKPYREEGEHELH